jgi:hypothetical protein
MGFGVFVVSDRRGGKLLLIHVFSSLDGRVMG